MSTLRISNIEAKSVPASATIDEKVKITNSSGDTLVFLDGKTSGITTVGINTTDGNITFDANSNVVVTGIITATRFSGQITPTSLEIGSNIKLGNAGVITATSFVGSGAQLTGITSPAITSITNDGANRVLTSDGDNTATAESNLSFDGTSLAIGNGNIDVQQDSSSLVTPLTVSNGTSGTDANTRVLIKTYANGGGDPYLMFDAGGSNFVIGERYAGTTNNILCIGEGNDVQTVDGIFIRHDGKVGINETSPDQLLHIKGSNPFIELEGTTNNSGDVGIFLNANGNHWLLRADNYPSANAFSIKDGDTSSSTHRLTVAAGSGNVTLNTGNLIIGTSGKGIDFSNVGGSASGSSSALLDDYEEGSWTPSLNNTGTISYSHQIGRYTKVGRQVHFIAYVRWNSRSNNGAYNITYSGLPFTSINVGNMNTPIYVGGSEGFSCNNSDRTHIGGSVYVNNTGGQFRVSNTTGSSEISFSGAYGSTGAGYIYWSGSYYAS